MVLGYPFLGVFWSMLREPAGDVHLSAVELSDEARARKRRAIDCHNSQVGVGVSPNPMLGATELGVCAWPREHYVVEPR